MNIDREKTAVELQREQIEVESVTKEEIEKEKEEQQEEETDKEEETEEVEKEEEKSEDEEVEEEVEEVDPEELKKRIKRLEKSIAKKVGSNRELKKELTEAQEALAKKVVEGEIVLTEEDVEKRAVTKAQQIAAQKEFDDTCNRLAKDAKKIDPEFDDKIAELAEEVAPIPGAMIGMLGDLDNGGAVLNYFADHPEEYEEVIGLSLAKQALRLSKLDEKLTPKKEKKEISKVPPPNKPLKPSNNTDTPPSDKDDMETWVRKREAEIAKKRARG